MLAVSRRGRSHGHEGKPRDDHFGLRRNTATGWDILAVADGAGSAPFSRQGSKIACETVTRFCDEHIATEEMEACIRSFGAAPEDAASRRQLETAAYKVLCKAAFAAYQAIHTEAQARGRDKKDYATTLLFALCKYFDFGWFVVSFGVGDGAMAILEQAGEGLFVRLLAEPDEGEFGGQTRFLTMEDIFRDPASLQRRIHVEIVPDFTAILLMTDGVSDAKFETNANLHNPHKWDVLWQELVQAVPLKADGKEAQQKLLDWLNFWSPGNHDDRTLALLY